MAPILTCKICKLNLSNPENPGGNLVALKCGHVFHRTCLIPNKIYEHIWLKGGFLKCPTCQTPFSDMTKLHPTISNYEHPSEFTNDPDLVFNVDEIIGDTEDDWTPEQREISEEEDNTFMFNDQMEDDPFYRREQELIARRNMEIFARLDAQTIVQPQYEPIDQVQGMANPQAAVEPAEPINEIYTVQYWLIVLLSGLIAYFLADWLTGLF